MQNNSASFTSNATAAIGNAKLQKSLNKLEGGLQQRRAQAVQSNTDFELWRDQGSEIKQKAIANLPQLLERFEEGVEQRGGTVHWARDAGEALSAITTICQSVNARTVAKGKSMVSEEIGLNEHLASHSIDAIETDLGEYILQLRGEAPSHIVVPAFHLDKSDIAETFHAAHNDLEDSRSLDTADKIVAEARNKMRRHFVEADVGITGANFLVAENGATVIVTNEGNGDLARCLPRTHIVVAGIEKIVPTMDDTAVLLRLLSRSATGQAATAYVTFSLGVAGQENFDGPDRLHVVLVDNGRSELAGSNKEEVLKCIRCGACMNHCPVYNTVGGHSYGWVYPGPIGAALNPGLLDTTSARHLPNASTFCGRCDSVCPVRIPLTGIMRHWRNTIRESSPSPLRERVLMALWAWLVLRPRLYHLAVDTTIPLLRLLGRGRQHFRKLPLLGAWTKYRDFPVPQRRPVPQHKPKTQRTTLNPNRKNRSDQ